MKRCTKLFATFDTAWLQNCCWCGYWLKKVGWITYLILCLFALLNFSSYYILYVVYVRALSMALIVTFTSLIWKNICWKQSWLLGHTFNSLESCTPLWIQNSQQHYFQFSNNGPVWPVHIEFVVCHYGWKSELATIGESSLFQIVVYVQQLCADTVALTDETST